MGESLQQSAMPTAERVAQRALVLTAVSCRGMLERDATADGSKGMLAEILPWLDKVGVRGELEDAELAALETPLGELEEEGELIWQIEAAGVMLWALGKSEMEPTFAQWHPKLVGGGMGFLSAREQTVLVAPKLRGANEIGQMLSRYLTAHWRLREYQLRPQRIDFEAFVRDSNWGPLSLDGLDLEESELVVYGSRIDGFTPKELLSELGVVAERHRALKWLAGSEQRYSEVMAST